MFVGGASFLCPAKTVKPEGDNDYYHSVYIAVELDSIFCSFFGKSTCGCEAKYAEDVPGTYFYF